MKKNKSPFILIIILTFIVSIFFVSVPNGLAQSELGWTEPINLSKSGASTDPLVVVGTDGVIHVIWIDDFDGYKYVESPNGVEWTTPISVSFPFLPEDAPPRFEVTANGLIHAFWEDDENILYYAQVPQINMGSSNSWRSLVRLGVSVVDYDVETDDTDGLHVSYIKNEGLESEPAGVYYRRSTNGGGSWSVVQMLFESQYLRSLTNENAHVRVAASSSSDSENIYVVWDNPALKRIFMSRSLDRGQTWESPSEVIGLDQNLSYESYFNAEIESMNDGILLTWQAGEPGIRCSQYSIWSTDGGIQWSDATKVFEELESCPQRIGFKNFSDGYGVAVLKIEENVAMIAWNGNEWSNLQIQDELSSLSNPITFDPILFHCQYVSFRNDNLFAVGCDDGDSKDIWFSSRSLGTVENWFPPPSAWNSPQVIADVPHLISSISSIADLNNNVHVVWVESPLLADNIGPAIYYSLWNGDEWLRPAQIFVNTNSLPLYLSLTTDNMGRLFLAWVDEINGDLLFSWANSSRANIPLEWTPPKILPSPAKLIGSPDVLVDSSGNIVVAYAITLNESRGIYMVRSNDFGETWSTPSLIFDAVTAEWDAIDRPRLALNADGRLHALFSQFSVLYEFQPMGLYYSQSDDGGGTWNDVTEISNKPVYWHRIYMDNIQTLHLLWQEKNGQTMTVYHRTSTDGGLTWNNPVTVSSTRTNMVITASATDMRGQLHLLQLVAEGSLSIQEWSWDGLRWNVEETRTVLSNIGNAAIPQEFLAEIMPDGYLSVLAVIESEGIGNILENSLISLGRRIDIVPLDQVTLPAVLPTPALLFNSTTIPGIESTPTTHSPLAGVNDSVPVINKNVVGLAMIVVVLILLVIVIRPTKSDKRG